MKIRRRLAMILYKAALRLVGPNTIERRFRSDEAAYSYGSEHGIPRFENFETYVRAYTSNPWVNGAIKARADATASAPLKFYKTKKERNPATGAIETVKQEVSGRQGSIIKMFQRPNAYMTASDLWEWVTSFLLLDGNAYLVLDWKNKQIWPLIPSRVRIRPHKTKFIDKYVYRVSGRKFEFSPEEVIHFKRFSPNNSFYGMGDIQALLFDLGLDSKLRLYLDGFFSRGARLSGIIEVDDEADVTEVERLEMQFNQNHGGSSEMHKVAFLKEGMKWKSTGQTNRDLQIGDLALLSRDSVMAIFRTPPAILGRWEQARFSNAREQVRLFFEGVQVAFWRKLESVINNHPFMVASDLLAEFDVLQVPQLRESDNEKAERGRLLIQSGQMTPDEVRRIIWGLPPYVDGLGSKPIFPKSGRNEDAGSNDPKADQDKDDLEREEEEKEKQEKVDEFQARIDELELELEEASKTIRRLELENGFSESRNGAAVATH